MSRREIGLNEHVGAAFEVRLGYARRSNYDHLAKAIALASVQLIPKLVERCTRRPKTRRSPL